MNLIRTWKGLTSSPDEGQAIILGIGWLQVIVKRPTPSSRNVGVDAELDDDYEIFTIKARIDPLESRENTQRWIGLVSKEDKVKTRKGDQWITNKPEGIVAYRVTSVNADEIMLERL